MYFLFFRLLHMADSGNMSNDSDQNFSDLLDEEKYTDEDVSIWFDW